MISLQATRDRIISERKEKKEEISKDVKDIGFSHIRIGLNLYKVLGWHYTFNKSGKKKKLGFINVEGPSGEMPLGFDQIERVQHFGYTEVEKIFI